jgi:hypothetical protein
MSVAGWGRTCKSRRYTVGIVLFVSIFEGVTVFELELHLVSTKPFGVIIFLLRIYSFSDLYSQYLMAATLI